MAIANYPQVYFLIFGLILGGLIVYLYLCMNSAGTLYIDSSDGVADIFRLDLTMSPDSMKKRRRNVLISIDPHANLSQK